jgi:hypothetical protein
VNANDSVTERFSSQTSDLNFLKLEELLGRSEELLDDVQTVHEAVETAEDQMFLKLEIKVCWLLKCQ